MNRLLIARWFPPATQLIPKGYEPEWNVTEANEIELWAVKKHEEDCIKMRCKGECKK